MQMDLSDWVDEEVTAGFGIGVDVTDPRVNCLRLLSMPSSRS
jgi:hypothetical protein